MRNLNLALIFVVVAVFGVCNYSLAADVAKIGVINLQRVIEASNQGKSAKAQIKKQKDVLEEDLKKKGNAIKQLEQRIEREAMVMSKEMREEKEREKRIKLMDFKSLLKQYTSELQKLEKQLIEQLKNDVFTLVAEIGKKEGYLLIISKIGVLYSPKTIDITDQLIKRLNRQFAKKSGN